MTVAVFFPSLMGVGILVSGALLISDWIRRVIPQGSIRRRHNVVVGTYGAIADAVDAAGYRLAEPWFLRRGLRSRTTYFAVAIVAGLGSAGSMASGEAFHNDPLGLFYHSPWAVGIGYGVGAALLLLALLSLFIAIVYRSTPRFMMAIITDTSLGRIILPTDADHEAALHDIEKES